ncbi:MAG: hypothetical protein CMJ64_03505 [Planctomycetaceae bacterium]|nr:hypothetical protein [Planctomycetaceae bacterium]
MYAGDATGRLDRLKQRRGNSITAYRQGIRGTGSRRRGVAVDAGGDAATTRLYNGQFGKWHIGMTFFDTNGKPTHKNGLEPVKRIDYSRRIPDAPIHCGFYHFFGTVCCPTTD